MKEVKSVAYIHETGLDRNQKHKKRARPITANTTSTRVSNTQQNTITVNVRRARSLNNNNVATGYSLSHCNNMKRERKREEKIHAISATHKHKHINCVFVFPSSRFSNIFSFVMLLHTPNKYTTHELPGFFFHSSFSSPPSSSSSSSSCNFSLLRSSISSSISSVYTVDVVGCCSIKRNEWARTTNPMPYTDTQDTNTRTNQLNGRVWFGNCLYVAFVARRRLGLLTVLFFSQLRFGPKARVYCLLFECKTKRRRKREKRVFDVDCPHVPSFVPLLYMSECYALRERARVHCLFEWMDFRFDRIKIKAKNARRGKKKRFSVKPTVKWTIRCCRPAAIRLAVKYKRNGNIRRTTTHRRRPTTLKRKKKKTLITTTTTHYCTAETTVTTHSYTMLRSWKTIHFRSKSISNIQRKRSPSPINRIWWPQHNACYTIVSSQFVFLLLSSDIGHSIFIQTAHHLHHEQNRNCSRRKTKDRVESLSFGSRCSWWRSASAHYE